MSTSRDGSYEIKKSMITKLMDDFDINAVISLDETPIMTQTVTDRTPEPYIYFTETSSNEEWVTKSDENRIHNVNAQVVVRYNGDRGNPQQRDEIVNQVIQNLTDADDFPDPSGAGWRIHRVTTGDIVKYDTDERGAKFFIANVPIEVTAQYIGYGSDLNPSADATYTYANFEFTPANNEIENYDTGSITVGNTYANNNGWNYASSTVAQIPAHTDGTLNGRVLTLGADDDDIGLTTTFTWQREDDTAITQTTTDSDQFERIRSLRWGAWTSDSQPSFTETQLRDFDMWQGDRQTIEFGDTTMVGETKSFTVNAGEWLYIIYDGSEADLATLTESVFNQNILTTVFENPTTLDGYKIYVAKKKSVYDATYTYTGA